MWQLDNGEGIKVFEDPWLFFELINQLPIFINSLLCYDTWNVNQLMDGRG